MQNEDAWLELLRVGALLAIDLCTPAGRISINTRTA